MALHLSCVCSTLTHKFATYSQPSELCNYVYFYDWRSWEGEREGKVRREGGGGERKVRGREREGGRDFNCGVQNSIVVLNQYHAICLEGSWLVHG